MLGMVLGRIGNWRGRLFVATDSRLLLVAKSPLRRARCTEIPYERIQVIHAAPKAGSWELRLMASGEPQTWNLMSAEGGERFARLVADRSQAGADTIEPAVGTACGTTPAGGGRLLLNVAGLAVVVLYVAGVLPREPALLGFFTLAVLLAVLEWRARTPGLQIALGVATAGAIGLFVFEILPFAAGALLATAAIAAEIAFRRRGERFTPAR